RPLVSRRHAQRRDRPGRLEGDADAAGARDRRHRRWFAAATAPGRAAALGFRRAVDAAAAAGGGADQPQPRERGGGAAGHAGHHAARRHRLAHGRRRALHHGRQDRYRPGHQPPRHRCRRPAQPAAAPAPPRPVHRLRAGGTGHHRGLDRGRGRRLRRQRRGPDGAQDRRGVAAWGDAGGAGTRDPGPGAGGGCWREQRGGRIRRARTRSCRQHSGRSPATAQPPGRWHPLRVPPPMNTILRYLADLFARFVRTLDWPLLAALLALMGIGLAVLHSAGGQNMALVKSQAARYVVGLGAMWLLSRIPPPPLRRATPVFYAMSLLPLVAVLFVGTGRSGAHWIDLGVFYFQPAELMKLSLPMMAAWILSQAPLPPRFGTVLAAAAVIALPTALILLQPDFGTAMLVAASGVFALYLAGMSWAWFVAAG